MDEKKLKSHTEIEEKQILNSLNKTSTLVIYQRNLERMIAEGEEDIKTGKTYSLREAKKLVDR